ncbi:hypothetical protein [Sinorhizobium medicae]|uniref:hypothetical protein n=1 Tax=Sinorhizobium medicae TaxID=110321 RepID=UPI001F31BD6F|nr:hypothetical protein [Sinorhizobium medicae]
MTTYITSTLRNCAELAASIDAGERQQIAVELERRRAAPAGRGRIRRADQR